MNVIAVKNLCFSYSSQEVETEVLKNVSFQIEEGSYTAIVGSNGSGKSTLARILCKLIPFDDYDKHIEINETTSLGLVFQSPKDQIVSGIISRDTAFGPQNLALPKHEVELRTIEMLNIVDMLDKANESTSAISLGQTQKVALAGIIAIYPDVLIMDEAVSMLDEISRKSIYEFLRYWNQQGKTIIHITHDMEAIIEAERIIHLEKGSVIFDGNKKDFLQNQQSLDLIKGLELPAVTKSKKLNNSETSLQFENVSFSYNQTKTLNHIDFKLYKGTLTALTGASGAGKSTIMELASGLLIPEEGTVYALSKPVLAQQNCSSALFEAFAADDVAFGPRNMGMKGKELKNAVVSAMEKVNLPYSQFKNRQTFTLSGGQQRRLAIAGILAMNKDILFFDEPTAGLDGPSRVEVVQLLRKLADEGKTVVFSTHKGDEAAFADREIKINKGEIVFDSLKENQSADDFGKQNDLNEQNNRRDHDGNMPERKESIFQMNPVEIFSFVNTLNGLRKVSISLAGTKIQKKKWIKKIPPIIKILFFLTLFVISLAVRSVSLCGLMLGISILYCLITGFNLKKLLIAFLKLLPFLLIFSVFQLMFHKPVEGEIHFTNWKYLTITPSKLWFCFAAILRTYSSLACISAFFVSTPEYDLIDGMSIVLKPLCLLKVPVRYFILVLEIIFRFIPLLVEEASAIIKTQLIRGGLGKQKGIFSKIKAMMPMIVPLIIQTIKRSESLAEAITMRCFK